MEEDVEEGTKQDDGRKLMIDVLGKVLDIVRLRTW